MSSFSSITTTGAIDEKNAETFGDCLKHLEPFNASTLSNMDDRSRYLQANEHPSNPITVQGTERVFELPYEAAETETVLRKLNQLAITMCESLGLAEPEVEEKTSGGKFRSDAMKKENEPVVQYESSRIKFNSGHITTGNAENRQVLPVSQMMTPYINSAHTPTLSGHQFQNHASLNQPRGIMPSTVSQKCPQYRLQHPPPLDAGPSIEEGCLAMSNIKDLDFKTAEDMELLKQYQITNSRATFTPGDEYLNKIQSKNGKQSVENHANTSTPNQQPAQQNDYLYKRYKDALGVRSFLPENPLAPRKRIEAYLPADFKPRWKTDEEFQNEIEMYVSLLQNFENIEIKMLMDRGDRENENTGCQDLRHSQEQTINTIYGLLQSECILSRVLSLSAGKTLICRVVERADSNKSYVVFGYILRNLRSFVTPLTTFTDTVVFYHFLKKAMCRSTVIGDFLRIGIGGFKQHELKYATSTQVGLTLLMTLLNHVEKILLSINNYSRQGRMYSLWYDSAVNILFAILNHSHKGQQEVTQPFEVFGNFFQHAARYLSVDDLKRLLVKFPSLKTA